MKTVSVSELKNALLHVCEKIISSEKYLTELDTIIGDGDHGFGMKIGFSALKKQLLASDYSDAHDLFRDAGLTLVREMGGTSGVIYGTLFIGGINDLKGKTELSVGDLCSYFVAGSDAIQRRGRVKPGDKTMYDAMVEICASVKQSSENDDTVEKFFSDAAAAAARGAENTKTMISRIGRSKNFRERTYGHPDTGAVSTTMIFEAFSEYFNQGN